jgi:hypothetical protein
MWFGFMWESVLEKKVRFISELLAHILKPTALFILTMYLGTMQHLLLKKKFRDNTIHTCKPDLPFLTLKEIK